MKSDPRWTIVASLDGVVRAVATSFQNLAGHAANTWHGAVLSNCAIEIVRTTFGSIAVLLRRESLRISRRQATCLVIWALFATLMTVLHVVSYEIGADQGVATLTLQTSLFWGVIFDWLAFGNKPASRQWCGLLLFWCATYSALGFPGLYAPAQLPWWVWFKLLIALLLATNELVRRKLAQDVEGELKITPTVSAFWVGTFSLAVLIPTLVVLALVRGLDIASYQSKFWVASGALGLMVALSTVLTMLSYLMGGSITLKKFFASSIGLALGIISGVLFFAEEMTIGKLVGMALIVVSYFLMDKEGVLIQGVRRFLK